MVLSLIPWTAHSPVLLLQSPSLEQRDLPTPLWPFSHTKTLPSCSKHGWAEAQALLRPVSEANHSLQAECLQGTLPQGTLVTSVSPVPAAPGAGMVTSEQ